MDVCDDVWCCEKTQTESCSSFGEWGWDKKKCLLWRNSISLSTTCKKAEKEKSRATRRADAWAATMMMWRQTTQTQHHRTIHMSRPKSSAQPKPSNFDVEWVESESQQRQALGLIKPNGSHKRLMLWGVKWIYQKSYSWVNYLASWAAGLEWKWMKKHSRAMSSICGELYMWSG